MCDKCAEHNKPVSICPKCGRVRKENWTGRWRIERVDGKVKHVEVCMSCLTDMKPAQ